MLHRPHGESQLGRLRTAETSRHADGGSEVAAAASELAQRQSFPGNS